MIVSTVSLGFQFTLEMHSLFTISKILTYSVPFKKMILTFLIVAIHPFTLSQTLYEFSITIIWKKESEKEEKETMQLVAQNSCPQNSHKARDKRELVLKLLLSYKQVSFRYNLTHQVLVLVSLLICMIVLR